jgi:hypothetical protein
MSDKGHVKKTAKAIKVNDLAPKKGSEAKVKGGSDAVMSYRYGTQGQHNETLLLDTGGFAR